MSASETKSNSPLLTELGSKGPFVLFLLTIYSLWDQHELLKYFTFGTFFNQVLNAILKMIIQQDRPGSGPIKTNLSIKSFFVGIYDDLYGMPSGHAQFSFFTTMFTYLALQNKSLSLLYLGFSMLVIYERVYDKRHTIAQVIVGAIIGSVVAIGTFVICKKSLRGLINFKPDENAIPC